jgi:transketolase
MASGEATTPEQRPAAAMADGIRRIVIDQSKRANIGHIGSALSVADIVAALYAEILSHPGGDDPERDRFVLSKGHAALALYAALYVGGAIDEQKLNSFATDGSELGAHPEHTVPGVDFSVGSLGHGLSIAAGSALAARMDGSDRRAFALVSDAECNEGSLWEAVMFAAHHDLSNLIAIVDLNGQQALGYTEEVLDLGSMAERWGGFGWDVHEVDGHDVDALISTIDALDTASGPPHVVVARTTFGKGVSFMESKIEWHYWPMSDDQYEQALSELQRSAP